MPYSYDIKSDSVTEIDKSEDTECHCCKCESEQSKHYRLDSVVDSMKPGTVICRNCWFSGCVSNEFECRTQ